MVVLTNSVTRFKRCVQGEVQDVPPIWLLRQAGRYLPEYREVRARAGNFLDLCFTPELAAEVTLQPIRRFDFDAAIVFSDILIVPKAMGQTVRFELGEGPALEAVGRSGIGALSVDEAADRLSEIYETVRRVRSELDPEKSLIGFCGAPWTVATYMVGGRGSSDQAATRLFALRDPEAFSELMGKLVAVSADYLVQQARAGCDVLQIFESWAGNLDQDSFEKWIVAPNRDLVALVRERVPDVAIIGFARGAGPMIRMFSDQCGMDMIGLDHMMPLGFIESELPGGRAVQGNLDPLRVVAGGAQMRERARRICANFAGRPHVFNLGHGIQPETPPEHVAELVGTVRGHS